MSQKFYNFLDYRLTPKVTCNVAFSDDNTPENLILKTPKAFMAYNVVKPPAELHFKFICRINIYCIKISTVVGSLKSTHIEIIDGLTRVAYGTCEKELENGVCFIRDGLEQEDFLTGIDELGTSKFFKTLRPTKDLKVIIKRTIRCPPVLKRIEIWGCLARDCTIMELETIEKLWNTQNTSSEQRISSVQSDVHEDFSIPEEFLDQITYELMSLPMTLPSGNIIDQSTVERCQAVDLRSGWTASDPFTGLPFTSERKPVFNAGLKVRIDHFLMFHSDKKEVKDVPRTTGTYIRQNDSVPRAFHQNTLSKIDFTKEMSFETKLAVALAAIRGRNASKEDSQKQCCCQTTTNLYKIKTCGDVICRKCLLSSKETRLRCQTCSSFFKRSDVEKKHLVNR